MSAGAGAPPARTDLAGPGRDGIHGQTTFDFLVAMILFLGVVGILFTFVPGILTPFTEDQDRPLVADRVADGLVGYHLSADDGPGTLNWTCTRRFFNQSNADGCDTFDTDDPLPEQVGIAPEHDLNVTIETDLDGDRSREVLCAHDDGIGPCSSGGTPLAVGDRPPSEYGTPATARRVVSVDDRVVSLVVRVW